MNVLASFSRRHLGLLGAFFLTVLHQPVAGQAAPAQKAADRPRFGTSTAAVLVDVVVRDKKGLPVTGLTASDFDVFEDGVRQKLIACDAVGQASDSEAAPRLGSAPSASTAPAPDAVPAKQDTPAVGQTVVALVFDWLSEQPRAEAWKAARTLVDDMKPGDYAGVFSIDRALHRLVPFTRDTAALSAGFQRALERPRQASGRQPGVLANAFVTRPEVSPTAGADTSNVPSSAQSTPSPGGQAAGSSNANADFAAFLQEIDDFDRYADKETQASSASDALRGLVQMLAPIPGRKTVVLFSEGLSVTNATAERWQRLEDEANRHNVSFYTFDAVGLRVQSQQAEMGRVIGPEGGSSFSRGLYGDGMERRTEALLGGPTHGLAELALATGGQYISNSNNLSGAFASVNQDRRSYYMLSYSSTNAALDGSFRSISVKVHRPGVTIRARRGYVASPSIERLDHREYEGAAVAALTETPQPASFPFRLQAFSTPMPGQPGLVALVASLEGSALTFSQDTTTSRYSGEATILTRVKSPSGEVLSTRSQHYELSGDLGQQAKAQDGRILYFAAPNLPPGAHTVEWVVRDDEGKRASVARSVVEVPAAPRPVVGDLIVVAHSERAPKDDAAARNPLAWKGLLLYPGFGEPFSRSKQRDVSFALPMVVEPRAAALTAQLRLMAGNHLVADLPFALGQPAKSGRLVALGHLPIGDLPPGSYELQVTVADGNRREIRSAEFSVIK